MKGERLCAECVASMDPAKLKRDIQLPELEQILIRKAAKARNCNTLIREDEEMGVELNKACDVQ